VDLDSVRAAYSSRAQEYIDLFDGAWDAHEIDAAFIRRHFVGCKGSVLDLGCGPGYWTDYVHRLGLRTTGIDMVPEFVDHARRNHPGPEFRRGLLTQVEAPEHAAAGVLSWYSTIHLSPEELDTALAEFRRLLAPGGVLVLGYFEAVGEVRTFDHAVAAAFSWPADVLTQRLAEAGLVEVERMQRQVSDRPNRRYAAIAAHAA
jgi:SAM-dependent methyltransferase